MKNFDAILKQIWPSVREHHFYPELPVPQMSAGIERVGLEMKGKKISLSVAFVNSMKHRLDSRLILEGLLDHAISHYLYCPWDFATHVRLYGEANSIIDDKTMAKKAADAFMDVVADTHCVSHKETPLPDLYRQIPRGKLDEVIYALYQKMWGLDLGATQFKTLATRLSRIDYLDRRRWPESMRRFASALKEFFEEEDSKGEAQNPSTMGDHSLNHYLPQEIEEGLKKLAFDVATPVEFKSLLKDIQADISKALGKNSQAIGLGQGDSFDANLLYYMKLSQKYALPIQKRPIEKSGSLYPHHHVPWEVGKPFHDIDPWKSFGKIMPGLSKSWQRVEGEMYGQLHGTPDCIIIVDSSGSMIDPRKKTSFAILGAACAADAYLRNGSRVAVYNFSDASAGDEHILLPTRDRRKIYAALCRYFGGGTHLSVSTIQSLQTDHLPDMILITDMQLSNLENVLTYFNACKNRIAAVLIGNNRHIHLFRKRVTLHHNVRIHSVQSLQDIPKIVLGALVGGDSTRTLMAGG